MEETKFTGEGEAEDEMEDETEDEGLTTTVSPIGLALGSLTILTDPASLVKPPAPTP